MSNNQLEIIKKLDSSVMSVIGNKALQGFQKAHVVSQAIMELKQLLTDEYMKPIMALQGNRLGFKTDKDKSGGYPMETVRNCLIEAVLMGMQPTGNQFNIIAGNTYATKEGCGYMLDNIEGLSYTLICSLPRINPTNTSAAVDVTLNWTYNGKTNKKTVPIPLKMDNYTSVDALIGKATRKGRAWLLSNVMGVEITDGEISDTTIIKPQPIEIDHELDRATQLLESCKTLIELDEVFAKMESSDLRKDIVNVYEKCKENLK